MPQSQEGRQFWQGYRREVWTWKVRRKCMTFEGHCKGSLLVQKGCQNSHRQCHWGMLVGTWVSEGTCIGAELWWECWGCEEAPWTKCAEKTADELQMNLVSNVCVNLVLITRCGSFYFCLGMPNIQHCLSMLFQIWMRRTFIKIEKCRNSTRKLCYLLCPTLNSRGQS